MADPPPGRAGAGSLVSPMPPFPPPQYRQGTPPFPYPSFYYNPSAPQGFSGPGQVHEQSQQHPSNCGSRFPGTLPSWTGYGFHGPPPSYGPQVPLPDVIPGPPSKSFPGMTILAQSTTGPLGTEFAQQRNSFGVLSSQNVLELGQITPPPPGIRYRHFRAPNGVHLSQDISGITNSGLYTTLSHSSGCVQVWNSTPGAAPRAIPGGGGGAAATQSFSVPNGEAADSEFVYDNHQLVNVVEQALLQSRKEKLVDLKGLVLQIRSLISKVERTAEQIPTLIKDDLGSSKSFTVACPFDPAHKIVPEGLFHHYLRCPSNPKPQLNGQSLVNSLHYRRAKQGRSSNQQSTGALDNNRMMTEEATRGFVSSSRTEFDIWGGKFFYEGAWAIVQAPLSTVHPPPRNFPSSPVSEVPGPLRPKSDSTDAVEPSSTRETSDSKGTFFLLPSRFFFLSKEIEAWEGLPSRSSSLIIEAAIGLGRVPKPTLINWLLVNSPAHSIVIDSTLASHIYSLARACFQEVHNEACELLDREYKPVAVETAEGLNNSEHVRTGETKNFSQFERTADVQTGQSKGGDLIGHRSFRPQVQLIDCARVFRSLDWLSAQLCPLFGSSQSKNFTLNLLKHSMVLSGRLLSSPLIGTFEDVGNDGKGVIQNLENERLDSLAVEPPVVSDVVTSAELVDVGKSRSLVLDLEVAVAAVNERAVLERYLRTPLHANRLPKFQLIQEYEAAVQLAAEERMRRPNYRPVLDSDGLIWHRSQLEERNKNKTKEEILAEERDYKRRRMSYRGKKLKRTPTQVVRDIIEGHMEEIVAAGGIGYALKQTVQALPAKPEQISKGDPVSYGLLVQNR